MIQKNKSLTTKNKKNIETNNVTSPNLVLEKFINLDFKLLNNDFIFNVLNYYVTNIK